MNFQLKLNLIRKLIHDCPHEQDEQVNAEQDSEINAQPMLPSHNKSNLCSYKGKQALMCHDDNS